ncbi:MAG: alpha/beta hydrolase [Pararhodobacter sp.]
MAEYPPLGRFVTVEGQRLHVLETGQPRGQAPDVVLIHGANGNLRDFTFDITGRLEDAFHLYVVDRPGLGYSESAGAADTDPAHQARVLRAALARLGLRRPPIVVGQSYGGAVAMAWALQAPEDTAALVIISGATHPWGGGMTPWNWLNDTRAGPPARTAVSALAPEAIAAPALALIFAPNAVPEGYAEHFGTSLSMRRASQAASAAQVNALHEHLVAMAPRYPSLSMPIEVLHGDRDLLLPLDTHARPLVAAVPSARLTVLHGAGHMAHHADPDAVAAAVFRAAERAGLQPGGARRSRRSAPDLQDRVSAVTAPTARPTPVSARPPRPSHS